MEPRIYATGAEPSTLDVRDFKYQPDLAALTAPQKGGERYQPEDIEDQHRVGICTAISLTQNARKALGIKFSADFQYLLQKKYFDKNWNEGSSARSALHVAYTYGLLPEEAWTFTTIEDRKLSYSKYIAKLKAVPEKEILKLIEVAKAYKLAGYAQVPINRDLLAKAVDESRSGLIVRFVVGREWYTAPIEPIRYPKQIISGHLIVYSNYDGMSYRLANTWGTDWADKGTGYSLLTINPPTEAWIPYYNDLPLPDPIQKQKEELESLKGELKKLIQKIVKLLNLKM
jgi:hypothetical protein